ncbi:molybdopterin-dependent oxidoreductase [Streptomyces sp. P38-E01]|uniref:Molybdopterin-dependent oxidoreductase n=1 Tax=Streptomyces tardus TaxID=2780544 RepID=A0A949JI70_9ACTN|nr:molybdopterin-dependent oxidoreductase [Streptomyces tardus]MBU7600596.1 molybdopterin-dependent oxidoreductase [Streptomyces tardus]
MRGVTGNRARKATRNALAAFSGVLAALAALAFAELASAAVRPEASPVTAVGSAAIDQAPTPVKDWAIRTFGEDDKLVLQLGIVAVLTVFALVAGVLALRFRWLGTGGVLVFGVVGAGAALTRPDGGTADALPSLAGALVGAVALHLLIEALRRAPWLAPDEHRTPHDDVGSDLPDADTAPPGGTPRDRNGTAFDRRGFVAVATATAAVSAGAGLLGRHLNANTGAEAAASREAVRLPAPRSAAPAIPRGAELAVRGVAPFTTPNRDFYRVDTALVVPKVNADTWRLRIHGQGVRRELELDFRDLLERDLVERDITMCCVSNQVGGPYVSSARWLGVPLAELLREAGVRPPSKGGPADQLVSRSVDGMTIGTPVETVMDGRDAMLAVGMNGEPLPFVNGFPVRMLVPGLYGYVSACKWLEELELTTFEDTDVYWVKRDWAQRAPVKTQSRIDVPEPLASLKPGTVRVAGVAWAQHRGIDRVEVRVDEGPWQEAGLAAEHTKDTWRQWVFEWPARPGRHRLEVRATDGNGELQTGERVGTVPDGATGRHSVVVNVD